MDPIVFNTREELGAYIQKLPGKGRMFVCVTHHKGDCTSKEMGQPCNCTPVYRLEDKTEDPTFQELKRQHIEREAEEKAEKK